MIIPKLDKRNAADILREIDSLHTTYTPEWQMNEKEPDAGFALAYTFSNMCEDLINRVNKLPLNHYYSFLNMLDTAPTKAAAASGYINVEVVPTSGNVFIPEGTRLYATQEESDETVFFETTHAITAYDNGMEQVYYTDSAKDLIVEMKAGEKFPLFEAGMFENQQKNEMFLPCGRGIYSKGGIQIQLQISNSRSQKQTENGYALLSDQSQAAFFYYTDGNWKKVESFEVRDGQFYFTLNAPVERFQSDTIPEDYYLKLQFFQTPDDAHKLVFDTVRYGCQSQRLVCDALYNATTALPARAFLPFGERYYVYSDFYLACEEGFSKAGAQVEVTFDLDFVESVVQTADLSGMIKYKLIMRKPDFLEQEKQDITIDKVIWEYWNQNGWNRLFADDSNENFFQYNAASSHSGKRVLRFEVPQDMASIVIGAHEGCYIRARIVKINNEYSTNAQYICPLIQTVFIDYQKQDQVVDSVWCDSNLQSQMIALPAQAQTTVCFPFVYQSAAPAMYFGLREDPSASVLHLYFDLFSDTKKSEDTVRSLFWECQVRQSDQRLQWVKVETVDYTDYLHKSGLISFLFPKNMVQTAVFGRPQYWIRAVEFTASTQEARTVVNNVYFNAVEIIQKSSQPTEYFYVDVQDSNKVCTLFQQNVYDLSVWVNECGRLKSSEEALLLENPEEVDIVYDHDGNSSEFWVRWKQVDRFDSCGDERVYIVDSQQGTVQFGDGIKGRIPPLSGGEYIRIDYSVVAGEKGNIRANRIEGFSDSILSIDNVTNFSSLFGGSNKETNAQAAQRISAELPRFNRVVTGADLEKAVQYLDSSICKVKCVMGMDAYQNPQAGAVTVIVMQKDYQNAYRYLSALSKTIYTRLLPQLPVTMSAADRFYVIQPDYIALSVNTRIVIDSIDHYDTIRREVSERLNQFIDPIGGGYNKRGRPIGTLPIKEHIYNIIKTVKGIRQIKSVNVFASLVSADGNRPIDLAIAVKNPYAVGINGEHTVEITLGRV